MDFHETGIDFANNLRESDSLNVFTYEYIYNGGGVGIADVNNDGLADVFFAGNMVSSRLYLNEGNCRFKDVTEASRCSTSLWCTGVAMVDINEDGLTDIYVSTAFPFKGMSAPNLLFINKGNDDKGIPVFEEKAAELGLNDSSYCSQAAFFDYDLDGDLDVYLCINSVKENDRNVVMGQRSDGGGSSQDKLFRNEGIDSQSGLPRFTDISKDAGILTDGWGLGLIVKDINRDGWPDIYVANDFQSNDHLYINNRNGTFTNKIGAYLAHQSHNSMGVDIADFNNDGLEDICVVDMLPDDNLRQKTMFGSIPNDKYHAALNKGYQPQFVRNVLQLNNGLLPDSSGTFAFGDIGYMAGIAATDWSWSPLWADFDMDGWRDLLITNGYVKDVTDLDFVNHFYDNGMFGGKEAASVSEKKMELARKMGEVKKRNFLFHNSRNLTFSDKSAEWGFGDMSCTNGGAYVDIDNDGDLDIIMNNLNEKAFVYQNNSRQQKQDENKNAFNYISLKLNGAKSNNRGIGAKITLWQNGQQQYAEQALQRGYLSSIDDRIYFGLGANAIVDSLEIIWPGGERQLLKNTGSNKLLNLYEKNANDTVNHKKRQTITLFSNVSEARKLHYSQQENDYMDFNYQYGVPHRYSIQGPSISIADVNGDGLEDIYTGGASRHSGSFFIQTMDGFIVKSFTDKPAEKLQEETGTLLFDADNDGDNDLYCVAGGNEFGDSASYQDMFFTNDGKGNFKNEIGALPNTSASGSCVSAADYDHDGDLDLFIGGRIKPRKYPLPGRSYLLRNDTDPKTGRVRFKDVTSIVCKALLQPGMVTSAIWTDYNNDGFADLFVTGEFMPLRLYKNNKGRSFELLAITAFSRSNGWYNSLTAADFDNDGDMDYVAGNLGLNSKYKASDREPVTVRYHDFNNDGSLDSFVFGYLNGTEFPTQPRNIFTDQIPSLKKDNFYYRDFGKKGYREIFTPEQRNGALEIEAYEMASLYIENNGKDNFTLRHLPMQAQTAPMFGMVAFDADEDGNLDLLAVGNSYAPEALTGRYDGSVGWVLKGDGKGGFDYMPPQNSGFALSGDAKGLAGICTANNNFLLIATQNSGPAKCFAGSRNIQCAPIGAKEVFAIYLLKNGRRRKEEFFYGSSYLSQSGRFVTFNNSIKSVELFSGSNKKRTLELKNL
ncbi:MAG: VCBS repeat-containing protein [Chitinophagaceae bacterium]|nr:VCBS repeat-containing protein [Chitinophagaceae bacterium]